MSKLTFLIILAITSSFATSISVETLDEQFDSKNILVFRARINNAEKIFKELTLKFCIKKNANKKIIADDYYTANAKVSLNEIDGENVCVDVTFDKIPMGIYPDNGGISIGLHYADWSSWNKTASYSAPKSSFFSVASNVALYEDGYLIYGSLPLDLQNDFFDAKFFKLQPETKRGKKANVCIKNTGNRSLSREYLTLIAQKGNSKKILNHNLEVGDSICVTLDSLYINENAAGNLILAYDSVPVDYIAWGEKGKLYSNVSKYQFWEDDNTFLKTKLAFRISGDYEPGDFFFRHNLDDPSLEAWKHYSWRDSDNYGRALPSPSPISLPSGIGIVLGENDSLSLVWTKIDSAQIYRLTILSEDSVTILQKDYSSHGTKILVPRGTYLWNVQAAKDPKDFITKPSEYDVIRKVSEINPPIVEKNLNVTSISTRKDTKLLNVVYGPLTDFRPWDRENEKLDLYKNPYSEDEGVRCWAVAILMLNHYYYRLAHDVDGNLTLDELNAEVGLHFAYNSTTGKYMMHPSLAAFRTGNVLNDYAGWDGIIYGLTWALNLDENHKPAYKSIAKEHNFIDIAIRDIDNGKPLYVIQCNTNIDDGEICPSTTHAMVVDGYRKYSDGIYAFHFLNVDNYGSAEWREFSTSGWRYLLAYHYYDIPTKEVRTTNSLVHTDSDEDGVMDFDEIYRFDSKFDMEDTDGDGVKDKVEIYSYAVRENYECEGTGRIKDNFADIDGDSRRAENDEDSDNDKLKDGEEDRNGNGKCDLFESDPYIKQDVDYLENIQNITLYAFDFLRLNDGVKCYKSTYSEAICDVASESEHTSSVILGVRTSVSSLYIKGGLSMRSRSYVEKGFFYGDRWREFLTNFDHLEMLNKQATAEIKEINLLGKWPSIELPSFTFDNTLQNDLIVSNNQQINLLPTHNSYRNIKVESGGILVIYPGLYYMNSIQLESGSKIFFANPGEEVVFSIGRNAIWRCEIANENLTTVARGFKMQYGGTDRFFVEGQWAGTLLSPNAGLVLGQNKYKKAYGQFVGKSIVVHQYSIIYGVSFNPIKSSLLAYGE